MDTSQPTPRKPYPTDVSDQEWAFTARYLTLMNEDVQHETGASVAIAYVDQGYTGDKPEEAAAIHGIELVVVKLPQTKKGFVLLPRRWVVERSFAWATRFRRLAKDYERLPETVAGLHFLVFAILMLKNYAVILTRST